MTDETDDPGPYPPRFGRSPGMVALDGLRELERLSRQHLGDEVRELAEGWLNGEELAALARLKTDSPTLFELVLSGLRSESYCECRRD